MSVDSYLCLCCLSTDNLFSLFDKNHGFSFTESLENLFSIILLEQDSYDDYICLECTKRLVDLINFKKQVFKSIGTLQVFGLIKVINSEGKTIIHKVNSSTEKDLSAINENKDILNEAKVKTPGGSEDNKNSDIIHPFVPNPVTKLKRDNNTSTNPPDKDVSEGQDLKCMICMEIMPNSYTFNTHMNKHFPNYMCEECGRSFMSEKRLKRHRYCHKIGPFVCPDCGVNFSKYNTYISHRKYVHSGPAKFPCRHCSLQFATLSQRNRHAFVTHDEAPRHQCAQCDKSFITSGLLSAHTRYKHQKLLRFFCGTCSAGFFHKVELVGHCASRHGGAVYKCDQCSKSYLRKKALTVHQKLHSGAKRFSCDVCERRFLQKCTLITHLKVHSRVKKKHEQKAVMGTSSEINKRDESEKVDVTKKSDINSSDLKIQPKIK